uniref:Uncharacterized protein n=1 Tax=Siphoviridae sp. ctL0q1 TaxID=2825449 RepID=A0A8S5PKN7_9CAUD|nr:MAG TPA: hypothetical protein [Siphoviridae sp. ctL0q1]
MIKQPCWVGTVLRIHKPHINIGEGIITGVYPLSYVI